jgi:type II secretory pathway pseudopilin PulG
MLIVVILLGILALAVIPQVSVSTEDAKLQTLKTDLYHLRSAIEIYYAQHNQKYPGTVVPGTKPADVTDLPTTFVSQLTRYTDKDGNISNTKDVTYRYGPYVKGGTLPTNPFNDKNDVTIDNTETNITAKASGGAGTGWKFYALTGVYMAADGSHDAL